MGRGVKTESSGEVLGRRWVELGGNEAAAECGPAEFCDRERITAWADDCDDSGEETCRPAENLRMANWNMIRLGGYPRVNHCLGR